MIERIVAVDDRRPSYANRQPDESVNYSTEHPLSEFAWLAGGVLASVALCFALVVGFAGVLASRIPFDVERDVARQIEGFWCPRSISAEGRKAQETLSAIADRLAKAMPEAGGITVSVYLDERPIVNAAATLGGNIVVFRGLLEKLESEDAVAMVLAHEIAHAAFRHPASHLGRGVSMYLLMAALSSATGSTVGAQMFQMAGQLPVLKYGRDQESEADAAAVAALVSVYGHAGGAMDVFRVFSSAASRTEGVEFLQTHPLTSHRTDEVGKIARKNGWAIDGGRRPLPDSIRSLR